MYFFQSQTGAYLKTHESNATRGAERAATAAEGSGVDEARSGAGPSIAGAYVRYLSGSFHARIQHHR